MARSRIELHAVLEGIPGPVAVYFQPPQKLAYPCILYVRSDSWVDRADNVMYRHLKRYDVTVIDRNPDSQIPDLVEALPYVRFDRSFVTDGLYHHVYNLYF